MSKNLYFLKQDGTRQYYTIRPSGRRQYGALLNCSHCKKSFIVSNYKLKNGQKNFLCSRDCNQKFQSKDSNFTCSTCGKLIYRKPSRISKSKTNKFFCSKACQDIANTNPQSGYSSNKRKRIKEKRCLFCASDLTSHNGSKYCDIHCASEHRKKLKIRDWLDGTHSGRTGKGMSVSAFVRNYLFEKHNHSCQRCGFKEVNPFTNLPILEVHHINGDPCNCYESNLEVLCKNCHAMTENYGSRNKNSPRTHR